MVGTLLLSKMSLNVITVSCFCISKNRFLKILPPWGFQFLVILDLYGINFHVVLVFGLGKDLLFKSVLGYCVEASHIE